MAEVEESRPKEAQTSRTAAVYDELVLKQRYHAVKQLFWCYITRVDYAHAVMMAEQDLLTVDEAHDILMGLRRLEHEIDQSFSTREETVFPQGQSFIMDSRKRFLALVAPELGEKLYLFRSTHELIHTILRMALKDRLGILTGMVLSVLDGILVNARRDSMIPIPARAPGEGVPGQPATWGAYLLGIAELLFRDCERVMTALRQLDTSPLGVGDGIDWGVHFNRARLAELLGFRQIQEYTLSPVLMNDGYNTVYETLQLLFFDISKIVDELLLRMRSTTPHIWWPEDSGPIRDILEELHLLSVLSGNTAASFLRTAETALPYRRGSLFTQQMSGYHVFDSGIRALRLFDGVIRVLKGDERAFLKIIDREGLVFREFVAVLTREEQLPADTGRAIGKRLTAYLSEHRLMATQVPFEVFQDVFNEEAGRPPQLSEDKFVRMLSPYAFLNTFGIVNTFSVTLEPVLARYEKLSFDLRGQLDAVINRSHHADQMLAKAVDDLIAREPDSRPEAGETPAEPAS
ncbi:MAG: hypothetical protein LBR29_01910 [Methylobacteriaceae bacterium]|jgi:argininosuccinate lyase|nr:hypothetical protein [Methylobacteriaceae bacterium]